MGAIETLMEQVMEQGQEQTGQPKKVVCKYSAAFKASVVEECRQTGVTKAEIARKYGIHSSVIYRWVKGMGQIESVGESVSQPEVPPTKASVPSLKGVGGPTPEQATEQTTAAAGLPRGFIPIATAAPRLPQGKDAAQELRPDKPPPDGEGRSAQSTAAWRAVRGMR